MPSNEENKETAVPISMQGFSGVVPETQSDEIEQLSDRDKTLTNLYRSTDWLSFQALVNEELVNLRQLKGVNLQGESNELLGERFRVANLAADMVEQLLLKVKGAHDQAKENEKKSKNNNS